MSDSVQPHRRQPTRLPRPWDSPGKNTGVGCHFLLQCMKVKSESEVTQTCPTLSNRTDCRLPGSSIHGIFQARVLEWGAIIFSNAKPMGHCKSNAKGKVHSNTGIPQETRKQSNNYQEFFPQRTTGKAMNLGFPWRPRAMDGECLI